VAGGDNRIRLVDSATGMLRGPSLPHPGLVLALAFSPDGKWILTGCVDKRARLWDAATGRLRAKPLEHAEHVHAAAFSPDGGRFLTGGGEDGKIFLWDSATMKLSAKPLHYGEDSAQAAFTRDGRRVVSGGRDAMLRFWNAETGEKEAEVYHGSEIEVLMAAAEPSRVLSWGLGGPMREWEAPTPLKKIQTRESDSPIFDVLFGREGSVCAALGPGGSAGFWSLTPQGVVALGKKLPQALTAADLSQDGKVLAGVSDAGAVFLWSVDQGKALGPPLGDCDTSCVLSINPQATLLAAGDREKIRVWDLRTLRRLGRDMPVEKPVEELIFSPEGSRIASRHEPPSSNISVWSAASGDLTAVAAGSGSDEIHSARASHPV